MPQVHPIQSDAIIFVTTNTLDSKPIFSNDAYAREAIEVLYRVQELHPFFLFGFVIMPNHAHLLLSTIAPKKMSTVIDRWKMGVSHSLGLGPIWKPRFFIRIPDDVHATLRYIHWNPVKAGLCKNPEQYPWSSASGKWDVTELGLEGSF